MKKQKNKRSPSTSERQWPRLNPGDTLPLEGITLGQGSMAQVVDISCGGALIETDVRLCPQAKIGFKVQTTQGTFRVTGSVLRSSIKALQDTPIYQSAIVFENPLTILDGLEPANAVLEESDITAAAEMEAET
jgi:hypothetical protein